MYLLVEINYYYYYNRNIVKCYYEKIKTVFFLEKYESRFFKRHTKS